VAVGAPKTTSTTSTSKELQKVERENPKGTGSAHAATKTPKPVTAKPDKDNRNPPINFGAKSGGGSSTGMTKQPSPYKGRLKQKGSGTGNHS
jgi:transcription initiation factor TFIID subunit TAF12